MFIISYKTSFISSKEISPLLPVSRSLKVIFIYLSSGAGFPCISANYFIKLDNSSKLIFPDLSVSISSNISYINSCLSLSSYSYSNIYSSSSYFSLKIEEITSTSIGCNSSKVKVESLFLSNFLKTKSISTPLGSSRPKAYDKLHNKPANSSNEISPLLSVSYLAKRSSAFYFTSSS